MTGGIPRGKSTHSTNRYEMEPYRKQATSPREEEKEERTLEALEGDHHNPFGDESLSPCRKKQRSDDNLQGSLEK